MTPEEANEEVFILGEEDAPKKASLRRRRISPIKSFWRHKLIAGLMVVLVAGAATPILWIRSIRPVYRAESLLLLAPIMLKNVIEDREYQVPRYDELVSEQLTLLVREEVTLDALERLGDDRPLWMRPGESRRDAAGRLSAALIARRVPDSTYIAVALEGNQPGGLDKIVNAVVDSYMTRVKGKPFYGQGFQMETLNRHKSELQEEIRIKTDQLGRWAKDLGVGGFEKPLEETWAGNKTLLDARARRIEAEARLAGLSLRQEAARKLDLTGEARDSLATDAEFNGLKAVLLPRKNELKVKAMGLTPQHEGRKEIERLIAEIDSDLERAEKASLERIRNGLVQRRELKLNDELQNTRSDVEQAKRFEETLTAETAAQAEKVSKFNALYYQAVNVRQDVDRLSRQLAAVQDRIDAIRLEAQGPGFIAQVSPAQVPEKPVARPMAGLIALFAALAVFLAFAVPTIVDASDHRVLSPVDVEAVIDARPMGWILERNPRTQAFVEDQLRRLALSLERQRRLHHRSQIAFMSLRPSGGTTQLVFDLARELRVIGSRVLVVEANALKPDERFAGPKGHPGLAETLTGRVRIEQAIVPAHNGLPDRVPIGNTAGRPLLPGSQGIRAMIEGLSGHYDQVLFDAPPILFSSDAELIASTAQGVVLVVEAGRAVTGEVKRAVDILREIGPLMIEIVVNRVRDYRGHGYYSDLVKQYEAAGRSRPSERS